MKVLVSGGAGYIGAHAALFLLKEDHDVVAFDKLANSSIESVRRVQESTGREVASQHRDALDSAALKPTIAEGQFDAVMHFAGLKSVEESAASPFLYYRTNVAGTLNPLESMEAASLRKLSFSSSATVYGASENVPLPESSPLDATNPYDRPGDAAVSYADVAAARGELAWTATRSLTQMCEDHWKWQSANPQGFESKG